MSNNTVTLEIQDATYTLKTHLPFHEMQKIEEKEFIFSVNGAQVKAGQEMSELEELDMRLNLAAHGLERMRHRLVGMKFKDIKSISNAHGVLIIERIAELEKENAAEVDALRDGDPTGTN